MTTQVKAPGIGNLSEHENRLVDIRDSWELLTKPPFFAFDEYNAKTVQIQPIRRGQVEGIASIPFYIDGPKSPIISTSDTWTLDLDESTIDTTTLVGGLVDGIALVNGRDYLIWAFLDQQLGFAGFGMTRKPYDSFSAGTAAKGATGTFTVTAAYQFTIGARVVVRNDAGTFPAYEWNWGTITAINSGTSISILMDNHSDYGFAITASTNGFIVQWNKFKPWMVTSTDQTLYSNYYTLVGEFCTAGATGNIEKAYRVDEEWRWEGYFTQIDIASMAPTYPTFTYYSLGRYLPLWATQTAMHVVSNSTTAGAIAIIEAACHVTSIDVVQVASVTKSEALTIGVKPNAIIGYLSTTTMATFSIDTFGYSVHGGMRY